MDDFKKQLVEKYKNPVFRKPALNRQPITQPRKPITQPRKPVGFIDDGKLRVVLDTNIFINAVKKEENQVQRNCMEVIELWKTDQFALGMQYILFEEYQKTGVALAQKGLIHNDIFNELMNLVREKGFFHRVLVTKQHHAGSYKDDHLFDGLSADYLVSEDKKDVVSPKVISAQASYRNIVTAEEFLENIRNQ